MIMIIARHRPRAHCPIMPAPLEGVTARGSVPRLCCQLYGSVRGGRRRAASRSQGWRLAARVRGLLNRKYATCVPKTVSSLATRLAHFGRYLTSPPSTPP